MISILFLVLLIVVGVLVAVGQTQIGQAETDRERHPGAEGE